MFKSFDNIAKREISWRSYEEHFLDNLMCKYWTDQWSERKKDSVVSSTGYLYCSWGHKVSQSHWPREHTDISLQNSNLREHCGLVFESKMRENWHLCTTPEVHVRNGLSAEHQPVDSGRWFKWPIKTFKMVSDKIPRCWALRTATQKIPNCT